MHRYHLLIALLGVYALTGHAQGADIPAAEPQADPFAGLTPVVSIDRLGPSESIRPRDDADAAGRNQPRQARVIVRTTPTGARVHTPRRLAGTTPLTLPAGRGATPLDLVIRHPGYMVLRTRIQLKEGRTYSFKLSPAKLL